MNWSFIWHIITWGIELTLSAKRFLLLLFLNKAICNSSYNKKITRHIIDHILRIYACNKDTSANSRSRNWAGTLWMSPSSYIKLLIFLKSSYKISTSLIVTDQEKRNKQTYNQNDNTCLRKSSSCLEAWKLGDNFQQKLHK